MSFLCMHMKVQAAVLRCGTYTVFPLQNPTLGVLVAEGGSVFGRRTGLWSTEAKVWGIVPRAAWHWGDEEVSLTIP
jgi:hypothetical protein